MRPAQTRKAWWSAVLTIYTASAVPTAAVEVHTVVMTLTGEAAPQAGGATFADFGAPAIDRDGRVAFFATLTGPGVGSDNDRGLWAPDGDNVLTLVAREGQTAPGPGGARFNTFISDAPAFGRGGVAFQASLTGGDATFFNNRGPWVRNPGTGLRLLARRDRPAPGLDDGSGNTRFGSLSEPAINRDGAAAFHATLVGSDTSGSTNAAVWLAQPAQPPQAIAREGDPVPDLGAVTYQALGDPVIGDVDAAFRAELGGVPPNQAVAIARRDVPNENLRVAVRAGQPAPGVDGGVFLGLFSPSLDGAAQAFTAQVSGPGVGEANNTGIWIDPQPGVFELIVREGDDAPGTGGAAFGNLPSRVAFDDRVIAFRTGLTGEGVTSQNDETLWVRADGPGAGDGPRLVARESGAAPGSGGGAFAGFELPQVNALGDVAFIGVLAEGEGRGLWVWDALRGELGPVVVAGQSWPVGPADERLVADVELVSGASPGDGRPVSMNNHREVAFRLAFGDGSEGLFRVTVRATPGDFDLDGDVDAFDLGLWQVGFGRGPGAKVRDGDADLDGDVDAFDLGLWQVNFGTVVAASIPEPAGIAFCSAVLLGLGGVRGRGVSRRTGPVEQKDDAASPPGRGAVSRIHCR